MIELGCTLWLMWSREEKLMEIKKGESVVSLSMHFGKKQGNELFFQSFQSMSFCILGLIQLILVFCIEAGVHRRSIKEVFRKISQNSQENTCVGVSFLIKLQA